MDGAVTREEAEARWRLDLEEAEADSRQAWPLDITAGMSEFERLTLITEILLPVRNELALEFEEAHQPDRQPSGDSYGDHDSNTGQEDETGVKQVYPVILAAAACLQPVAQGGPGAGAEGRWAGFRDPDDPGPGNRHRRLDQGTGQPPDGRTGRR